MQSCLISIAVKSKIKPFPGWFQLELEIVFQYDPRQCLKKWGKEADKALNEINGSNLNPVTSEVDSIMERQCTTGNLSRKKLNDGWKWKTSGCLFIYEN